MRRGLGGRVRRLGVAAIPAVFVFLASCASNAPQDTLDPDGPIANKQNNLFLFVFVIAAVVFVLVQGLLIATVVRHRHRPGRPDPVQVHGNTKLEFGWTVVPALLLVGVAFPTVFTIFDIAKEPTKNVLPVEVYGHLWWWEYRYPTLGVSTANELHIPTNTDVRLSLHSIEPGIPKPQGAKDEFAAGVIHSFWVPKLAGKQDVVPGRVNKLTIRANECRHVPRPVRRVLQPLPRQHAPAGHQHGAGRLRQMGGPATQPGPDADRSRGRQGVRALQRQGDLHRLPHAHRCGGRRGPGGTEPDPPHGPRRRSPARRSRSRRRTSTTGSRTLRP